jgi:long-chain fatty acid transport protein
MKAGFLPRLGILALMLLLGNTGDAFADAWKIQLQGVKTLGLGYAGRAAAEDASTVWFNPSGMTQLQKPWTITFSGAWIPFNLNYTDLGSRSVLGQPLTGPQARNGGKKLLMPVPGVYAVHRVCDSCWLGLGFNAPYGLSDDYGEEWVGRYHATESRLAVINGTATFAYRLHERLSVGGGFDVQHSSATLGTMIDFGSLGAASGVPLRPQGHDGLFEITAHDWAFGFNLSATSQIHDRLRVAATYRSQIEHTLQGQATFDVPAEAAFVRASGRFVTTGTTAVVPMPHELSIGGSLFLNERWNLVGDFTWTDWSQFSELEVHFDNPAEQTISQAARYTDSRRVGGGAICRLSSDWTIRFGGLYEDVPVPDATRTPRLPEENNLGLTFGGTYRLKPDLDLDFSVSQLIPHDAGIGLSEPTAGTLSGDVGWQATAIAVGFSYRFDRLWFNR